MADVDLHHGRFSHDPPYSVVEVFGVKATPPLRSVLGELGFHRVVERDDGFRAEIPTAAA